MNMMIAYLKGKIKDANEQTVLIEVGGVGYEAYFIQRDFDKFKKNLNQDTELCVYYYLRENTAELYAFFENEERRMFKIFATPRAAFAFDMLCRPGTRNFKMSPFITS